jgi:NAD+ diphosphatase
MMEFHAFHSTGGEFSYGEVYWFFFQGSHVLVAESDNGLVVPRGDAWQQLADTGLRHHIIGTLDGCLCHCVELDEQVIPPKPYQFMGLRGLFGRIDDALLAAAGVAFQVMDWDRTHVYCGRCGTPTEMREHERVRVCPACRLPAYPRISPVVMGLVVRDQELLLARSPHFAPGVFSAIAGFCEPGETLETALAREIREEVNVIVNEFQYFGSQPWPFPHSLMVSFTCRYESGVVVANPAEIEDARWFSIDALPLLPHPVSIARKLIDATVAQMKARYYALH